MKPLGGIRSGAALAAFGLTCALWLGAPNRCVAVSGVRVVVARHVLTVLTHRLRLDCDLRSGLWSAAWGGGAPRLRLDKVDGTVVLNDGRTIDAARQSRHRFDPRTDQVPIDDKFGTGLEIVVHHTMPGQPEIRQQFCIYPKLPYFLTGIAVVARHPVATNTMRVIVCDGSARPGAGVALDTGDAVQTLSAPYDNDAFVRYDSSGGRRSYEFTAVYDNTSRHGIVVGSVSHNVWKTGITFGDVGATTVGDITVYGGVADAQTRDTQPHGLVSGTTVRSPEIFVGAFRDWRDGLQAYGHANSLIHPPLPWSGGVPFGWNSWMAYETKIDSPKYLAVAAFIKDELEPRGLSNDGTVTINLDSFWDNMSDAQLAADVRRIHANGQKAGIYWTPFVYWGSDLTRRVAGTNGRYTYGDIVLKGADSKPLPALDGGLPEDPSHPGTLENIDYELARFVKLGFDYIKLDFLSHGAMEGKHYDPRITTGIEAYNLGMQRIDRDLSPRKIGRPFFISLSIAPLFPSGYGQSRRVSCDTWGQLGNSEYMLNSLTYCWWQAGALYRFNDADNTVLTETPPTTEQEARTRLNASVTAGSILLDSDPLTEPAAQQRALRLLTNPEIDSLAQSGRTFRPVEGNTGTGAADTFVRSDGRRGPYYVSVFNFSPTRSKRMIVDIARLDLNPSATYTMHDLWSRDNMRVRGRFVVTLAPAQSTILRLTTAPRPR